MSLPHGPGDYRAQKRFIRCLWWTRFILLAVTLIGTLLALTQYQYLPLYFAYFFLKMVVMGVLSQWIDQRLVELQADPDSSAERGSTIAKVGAVILLLIFAPLWVVWLLGRVRDRARTSLEQSSRS